MGGEGRRTGKFIDDPLNQWRRSAFGFQLDHAGNQRRFGRDPSDTQSGGDQFGKAAEVKDGARTVECLEHWLVGTLEAHAPIGAVDRNSDGSGKRVSGVVDTGG